MEKSVINEGGRYSSNQEFTSADTNYTSTTQHMHLVFVCTFFLHM